MCSSTCPRFDQIGTFPHLKYRKFVHVIMYLDAVGIDISNNQEKSSKVKPFRSQTKSRDNRLIAVTLGFLTDFNKSTEFDDKGN